jgi:thiol-disulfide isomerase/thioredoxin
MWSLFLLPAAALSAPILQSTITVHAAESFLLHRPLRAAQLRELRIFDRAEHMFRLPSDTESLTQRPPVRVLHVWADYCVPCVEELPILSRLAQRMEGRYGGAVRFLFVSETQGADEMARFLKKYPRALPAPLLLYQDTANELFVSMKDALPATRSPQLPLTLLIDEGLIIRQAFVGTLAGRLTELVDGIERLIPVGSPGASSATENAK